MLPSSGISSIPLTSRTSSSSAAIAFGAKARCLIISSLSIFSKSSKSHSINMSVSDALRFSSSGKSNSTCALMICLSLFNSAGAKSLGIISGFSLIKIIIGL